jgi:uncharacterized protein YfaS (alpha-2-macroglobulin family)
VDPFHEVHARLRAQARDIAQLEARMERMMSLVDDLRAAVAADKAADNAVLAYLGSLKASVDDLTAKLDAALANAQDPALAAAVQEAVDALKAHSADMAAHVPA